MNIFVRAASRTRVRVIRSRKRIKPTGFLASVDRRVAGVVGGGHGNLERDGLGEGRAVNRRYLY